MLGPVPSTFTLFSTRFFFTSGGVYFARELPSEGAGKGRKADLASNAGLLGRGVVDQCGFFFGNTTGVG